MKKTLSLILSLLLLLCALTPALAEAPQRIVVLPVWAAEMLLDAVGPERIVGLSAYCDDPTVTYAVDQAALVEGRVASNNAEGILMLSPDLVVLDTFNDYDGSLTRTLTEAGLPVLTLESPTDYEQIMDRLTQLGEATETEAEAQALVADMRSRLETLSERVADIPEDQRVTMIYYEDAYDQSGNSAGMLCAYGPGSTVDAIARAAGTVNVCDAPNYSSISKETLVTEWKPQMILVASSFYDESFVAHDDGGQGLISAILSDETLSSLPAVQEERVYAIDDRARSATSHYMVEAAERLCELAYPELYE